MAWIPNYVLVSGQYVQSGQINVSELPYDESPSGDIIDVGTISAGETDTADQISLNGVLHVEGTAISTVVTSGGTVQVDFGGTDIGATIGDGGFEGVNTGATVISALVTGSSPTDPNGGSLAIQAGGTASGVVITNGGFETVYGTDYGATILAGGGMNVSSAQEERSSPGWSPAMERSIPMAANSMSEALA